MSNQNDTSRILRQLENTKSDLKTSIEESENRILSSINDRIKQLETENLYLKKELETLRLKTKKNNILIIIIIIN